jgi:DNA-binding response OmpR family regulator
LYGLSEHPARILLVDDEQSIQTLLSYPLRKEGYEVVQATDGRQALDRFEEQPFDLVVLDLMLPRIDGLEICRRLRSKSSVPIIMLTAKSEEIDKVVGLELGADDYITKPFSLREFSSRIKAALRRAEMSRPVETAPDEAPLRVGDLRIDFPKRSVRIRGDEAQLTYVEFEILSALARAPGRVFTRDMLLARIWGDSAYRDPRTIDVHIRHLREKVEADPKDPEYLFTVRGVGYRFRDTEP